MPPHKHSDQPDSDFANLICPATEIFDLEGMITFISEAASSASDDMALRGQVVSELRARRKIGMKAIAEAFSNAPKNADAVIKSYAYLTDSIVKSAWHLCTVHLYVNHNPSDAEQLSVIAVGGYGRNEMAPHSDVDLLFLTPFKMSPWSETVIEGILYLLWDLRLKVGHSSRTIRDCIRYGLEDFTIRTAMLEHRYICGAQPLAADLKETLWNDVFSSTAREFVEAKLHERDQRHEKQGERYVVEPNVKEGKGGLRDLQSLFWIAKYIHGTASMSGLFETGMFSKEEFAQFMSAQNFLWAVRCHLHLVTDRAVDQLTFDMQVEVADRMGYKDRSGRRGVEHFMQDYFRHATRVGDLTRIFLTELEDQHVKDAPLLERIFKRRPKIHSDYKIHNNRIALKDERAFLSDPVNILRLFNDALRTGLLIHPNAMRVVSGNLKLLDEKTRNNPKAQSIFLGLLLDHGNPERALRRMNELGVLGAFIPEFEVIVAMMQYNMYHSYTVDEHTIQCIRNLAQIEKGELVEELPIASSILQEGIDRKVIYVALLLHDIGKGRKEDHSILGAKIARVVAKRLGLEQSDVETIEWLVRSHLLMSDTAQKRDIADPRTVRDFAKAVQSVRRLDLLTVLTVCDIRGVGPDTWNNWKATLIRALYRQTRKALETGLEALTRENRGDEAQKSLRQALSDWTKSEIDQELERHYPAYWQGLHVTAHVVFANLLRGLKPDEIRIDLHPDLDRDATRICFALDDHPGIFSRLAGALALVGANVVDARTYTSKDGFATPAFWVQDSEGHPYDAARLPRLRDMIEKTLKGEVVAKEAIIDKDKIKKREKAFKVPTSITFDNDGSDIYTIVEVDTRDRAGLLYDLTRTLAANNINIASAVVATYGEQVVDAFYVKDMFGLKIRSQSKLNTLENRLRDAITQGANRARS